MKPIKVLILDDSLVFREIISRGLQIDTQINVVATAENPYDAIDKIEKFAPDVITCDVHMPKMNGIEFIRQLLPQHSVPVIVVSAITDAVFDAMSAGAVSFLTKPSTQSPKEIERFINELIVKVKEATKAKIVDSLTPLSGTQNQIEVKTDKKVIAIGASTGGTEAIFKLLKGLPNTVPGIVIVQHIPTQFSKMFAERLNNQLPFTVAEAKGGEWIEQGKVLIAPGEKHMVVNKVGERFKVEIFSGQKVNGHCPSVDVLFESVAREVGNRSIGVILTGMGYDGAKGLLNMRRKGAKTIGQDENSSVVYGMPKAAYDVGAVEKQLPLEQIPMGICGMLKV